MSYTEENSGAYRLYNLRYVPLLFVFIVLGIVAVAFSYYVASIIIALGGIFAFLLFKTKTIKMSALIFFVSALLFSYVWGVGSLHLFNDIGLTGKGKVNCVVKSISVSEYGFVRMTCDDIHCDGEKYSGSVLIEEGALNKKSMSETISAYKSFCKDNPGYNADKSMSKSAAFVNWYIAQGGEQDEMYDFICDFYHQSEISSFSDYYDAYLSARKNFYRRIQINDVLCVSGEVSIRKMDFSDLYAGTNYRKKIKYSISIDEIDKKGSVEPSVDEKIKNNCLEILQGAQSKDEAGFSYAMLFGDTEYMNSQDKKAMQSIGAAHVFAVSGLHIGVCSAIILWILKKSKARPWMYPIFTLPILIFYGWLANFTPSILRSIIMVAVAIFANILGRRYDDISSWALAAVLILVVKPLYLFDVSFLMSFLAVFGICELYAPLDKLFKKTKMPKSLGSALALSCATSVSLLPITCVYFGSVSLISIFMNILIVPIISVVYSLTLILILLCAIFGSVAVALTYVGKMVGFVIEISKITSAWGFNANHDFVPIEIGLYYGAILLAGKHSLASRKLKLYIVIIVGSIIGILFAVT